MRYSTKYGKVTILVIGLFLVACKKKEKMVEPTPVKINPMDRIIGVYEGRIFIKYVEMVPNSPDIDKVYYEFDNVHIVKVSDGSFTIAEGEWHVSAVDTFIYDHSDYYEFPTSDPYQWTLKITFNPSTDSLKISALHILGSPGAGNYYRYDERTFNGKKK